MSTEIALISDALEPDKFSLEVYSGTGGLCLFAHGPHDVKIWLNEDGVTQLEEALTVWKSGFK